MAEQDDTLLECGVSGERDPNYDMTLHIASLFVIWLLSILGCSIPVLGRRIPALQINESVLQWLMAFGIGVVIATALIHMIPPAIDKLNDPCLGMQDKYPVLAMAIVLATILLMVVLETEMGILQTNKARASIVFTSAEQHTSTSEIICIEQDLESGEFHSPSSQLPAGHRSASQLQRNNDALPSHGHAHGIPMLGRHKEDDHMLHHYISTIIFECGVYMHSILIGLDLGVLSGSDFTALFVALSFHQFFEAIAVGNMASMAFSSFTATAASVMLFSLMTPIGILFGIMISSSFSATSSSALWVQGSLDAVAGGILLYTGVAELLTLHFTRNSQFHTERTTIRVVSYVFLLFGAFVMALIGKWA